MQRTIIPIRVKNCFGVRGGHARRRKRELAHESQHRPQAKIDMFISRLRKHMRDCLCADSERDGGLGMDSVTIVAVVEAGNVGGDQLALGRREWRFAAQQYFVILEQWPRVFGERLKNLQQPRLWRQRFQKRHLLPRLCAAAADTPNRVMITQIIENEASAEHWPGGKEENVRTFERMQILVERRKS